MNILKIGFATLMCFLMVSGASNAEGCRTMAQVDVNMTKLGYSVDAQGDNNKEVLDFVRAYSRNLCGRRHVCQTDNKEVLASSHVIVYTGRDDRAVFFDRQGCKSFSIIHGRGDLTSIMW